MAFKSLEKEPLGIQSSPWIIMVAAAVLLTVVIVFAIMNNHREKRYMSQILIEKSAALIKSFEAGARTGMMGMMWGEEQIQRLIEETSRQPDILYLAVTDENGLILAHNNREKIGKFFMDKAAIKALNPGLKERWHMKPTGGGRRVFEVYRYFTPLSGNDLAMCEGMSSMMGRHNITMNANKGWCNPSELSKSNQIIFAGLDIKPFEDARREDIRNTVIISIILIFLGIGGFLSVFYAQSYRITRRSLQDTSAFADEVVSNLPVGLIATDSNGKIVFFNAVAEQITGIKLARALNENADEVLPEHWCGLKEQIIKGQPILEQEMECAFSENKTVPLSVSASRIINEGGEFVGDILILKDLGEIRSLQNEIRQKEKLAAIGRLAGGVAHEIRNPLSSIKGLAGYFGSKFAKDSEDRKAADVMVGEVDRLNRVISELLELSRPSDLKIRHTDINKLLAHSIHLIQQDALLKNIKIDFSHEDNLSMINIDPDRITQCMLNLYLNAIQAMDAGGVLSIKSFKVDSNNIKIEIADTGRGIKANDLNKIFDPYFTTRPSGTGLGLAIVHKIIEAHQGKIKVNSISGKGTVFVVFLPVRPMQTGASRNPEILP